MHIQPNHELKDLNTLGLYAKADYFVCFEQLSQLPELQQLWQQYPRVWILGGGSNMVMDSTVSALVVAVRNRGIRLIEQSDGFYIVEAQAGESWHAFVQHCIDQGWLGLENLALIPGTVGAAPVQNIGAYGVELMQYVHEVIAWDFEQAQQVVLTQEQCQFSYRDSVFKKTAVSKRYLITAVRFKLVDRSCWQPVLRYPDLHDLQNDDAIEAQTVFNAVVAIRQRKLPAPAVLANAGSFFKNPVIEGHHFEQLKLRYPHVVAYEQEQGRYKLAAGWLIEQAGWKAKQLGPVGMHKTQALVLVNYGGATAVDVYELVAQVRASVYELFNVELEQEPVAIN